MAIGQFVSKAELFSRIKQIVSGQENGFLTILTDTKRSVLLRFSAGKLTQSHCRTKDVNDSIQVLFECSLVKYSYAPAAAENRPEVMPTETFLQLVDPGGDVSGSAMSAGGGGFEQAARASRPVSTEQFQMDDLIPGVAQAISSSNRSSVHGGIDEFISNALTRIAAEYLGPVAGMLVEEALEQTSSVTQAIDHLAVSIPDQAQADAFRVEARSKFPDA